MASLSCNCVLPSPEMRKWNEIIKKNMLNGDAVQAMVTYVNVQEIGFRADNFTFPILLKAAGSWSSPCIGLALHGQTIKAGFSSHVFVQTAVLNMYRSHRCVADACKVFEKMPVKDGVAWNSILDAYASTGKMDDALKVFNSMPLKDLSSFNIMVSGYSSTGKTLSARRIFDNMAEKDIDGVWLRGCVCVWHDPRGQTHLEPNMYTKFCCGPHHYISVWDADAKASERCFCICVPCEKSSPDQKESDATPSLLSHH